MLFDPGTNFHWDDPLSEGIASMRLIIILKMSDSHRELCILKGNKEIFAFSLEGEVETTNHTEHQSRVEMLPLLRVS